MTTKKSINKSGLNAYHGWINLHKPLHITSADAVNKAKWLIKPTKIGHAGTLDPLATGVLPLALGEGTKCINLLMDAKKTYDFSVTFGEARSTDDAEGEVVATSDKMPTEAEIRAILPRFTGQISQMPPIYSALKVDGRRAYDLARAGEAVVLEKRLVTVYSLEFLGFDIAAGSGEKPSPLMSAEARRAKGDGGEGLDGVPRSLLAKGDEGTRSLADNHEHPSPNPLPQGERAPPLDGWCKTFKGEDATRLASKSAAREALSPWGRGLGEGTGHLRAHLSLAQEEQAIDRAQAMRRVSTEAEQRLWGILRGRRLDGLKFRRQHPFGHYIADFVCLEKHLVIELDGGSHTTAEAYDAKRTAYFESQGFRVIRFWNNDVMGNIEGVVTVIRSQLSGTLTQPSPPGGEGSPVAPFEQNNGLGSALRGLCVARFRATVSKGTYIRSLGRDMAQACGSEGYISRLHRAAVGPFTDMHAISLDFLAESVHKAPPPEGNSQWLLPLERALDDIPALALEQQQWNTLRHGQRVTLANHHPDTPQLALLYQGHLVGLARVEGNQVISNRLLNSCES